MQLKSIEICAGAGGQALGLEQAGFGHLAVVELDPHACATLRTNRPYWNTVQEDITKWHATRWRGCVDLFAGGVPCPPFSKAGKQLGALDNRNLFPHAIRLIRECQPKAVMLENVRGLMDPVFDEYRADLDRQLHEEGYETFWQLQTASDFGVPQLRPRTVLVALHPKIARFFEWPRRGRRRPPTVGEALRDQMASAGWEGADEWAKHANKIAPTLVGGSHRHGGRDLRPHPRPESVGCAWCQRQATRHHAAYSWFHWNAMPDGKDDRNAPRLSRGMAHRRPQDPRVSAGRQHIPPPVARAIGTQIASAIKDGYVTSQRSEAAAA